MIDIYAGFQDPSALLKHELAYCLGQTENTAALPTLEFVLANEQEDPMVRHEVSQFFTPTYAYDASHTSLCAGSRGNGCHFLGLLFAYTSKISERLEPFCA